MQIVELKVNVEKSQLEALAAQVNKLNGKVINFKTSTTGAGAATAGMQKGFNQTAAAADKAGQSILGVVGKVAKWTAVTTAVYAPIKAFKEAVTTIKALDTEMVNVQKVTGASARQMQQFQDRAYQLSTQYGRSVTDVAAAMTSFARAGYGDKLDEMAELSTLVQNVGYVSEDTADRMLLAVDAAWKLNGSHTELMKVIDGVDKVTNQNATDFQKMAEGMTVAASVFAESGESIQTFAAMVGTGTAATQRGGSEIARGLRTIMMNIRQIKGETEDGELIDGESIAKASAALKEFAGISTMENGELRKASDVLADLAHKWDELDTVQQSAISEALAGKRQANILTALMGNWDMVEKQMKEYADAAGTAFKENDIYMDSWAAKTEQLKATWTDFVANFVTSDLAKGFLDGLIKGVEVLDSGFGQAAIGAGALALAFAGIQKAIPAIAGSKLVTFFTSLAEASTAAAAGSAAASSALAIMKGQLLGTLTGVLLPIALAVADFKLIKDAIDEAYVSMDEQEAIVADLKTQYEQLTGAGSEYAQLMDKVGTGTLTERERARLTVLNAQADALERQIKLEEERKFQMFQQQESGRYQRENGQMVDTGVGETGDVKRLQEMNKLYEESYEKVKKGESSLEDYRGVLQDIIADNSDWYEQMKEWEDLGFGDSFTDAQKEAMALYDTIAKLLDLGDEDLPIVKTLDELEESGMGVTEFANQTVVDAARIRQAFADAGMGVEETNAAIEALRASGDIVIDVQNDGGEETLQNLEKLGIATQEADGWHVDINGLEELAGKLGLSKTEADKLVDALGEIDGVNLDGAAESVGVIYDSVQSLVASNPTIEINAEDNASETINQAEGNAKNYASGDYTADINATDNATSVINPARALAMGYQGPYTATLKAIDNASSVIRGAVSALAGFASKTITLTANYVTSGKGPGGGGWGSGSAGFGPKATGDLHFKGGPVLLGDELSPDGSPRPELVITKNGAFIAGMTGPVMTSLPAGARIFKYSDTMEILSGGDLTQLQAFSLGDDYLKGKNKVQQPQPTPAPKTNTPNNNTPKNNTPKKNTPANNTPKNNTPKNNGNTGGGGGGGGSNVDTLKEELELLEAQYSYLEASNASTEELHNKSKEIQAKLHQINDTLRSTGGKEKDIVDNSTKWWQETEKQRQLLEEDVSLLEAQYEFMEESGASAEDLNAKSAEIQAKLHEINELARATGASQEDILQTSQKWWTELKKIHEVQRKVYQDERDLLQSQSDLMEHQNKSATERIAKLKQIQDNLHQEAEYMRSIKADQAEINQLSIQWWEIQEQILQIQKDLVDSLDATIRARLKQIGDEKDDAIDKIRDQIKDIEKERDSKLKELIEVKYKDLELNRDDLDLEKAKDDLAQKQLDKQEKYNKLLEAEKNLKNAMKERTVRSYNAATGQWEWNADAKAVQRAQEELDRARKDYESSGSDIEEAKKSVRQQEYELEKKRIEDEYDKRIEAREAEIDKLTDKFDDLEKEWDRMYDEMFGSALGNIENILQQMLDTGVITEEQANEIRAFWNKINGFADSIDLTTSEILKTLKSWSQFQEEMPESEASDYINYLTDWLNENGWTDENYNAALAMARAMAKETGASSQLAVLAARKVKADAGIDPYDQGYDEYDPDTASDLGKALHNAVEEVKKSSGGDSSSSKSGAGASAAAAKAAQAASSSSSEKSLTDKVNERLKSNPATAHLDANSGVGKAMMEHPEHFGIYDSGGIINGFGGIKATTRDEIVIPPDLADFMLRPSASGTFKSRVSELAYLYGAKPIPGVLSNNRSSNDHYGDTYTFGNVTLTEDKARTTTVYELAQMSRSLGIYRNG